MIDVGLWWDCARSAALCVSNRFPLLNPGETAQTLLLVMLKVLTELLGLGRSCEWCCDLRGAQPSSPLVAALGCGCWSSDLGCFQSCKEVGKENMSRDYFKCGVEQVASAILSFLCGGSAHLSCPVYSLTSGLCSAGAPEPALSLSWG